MLPHDTTEPSPDESSVPVWVKMVALVALIVIALIGAAVPLFWKRLRDSSVALSHLNAFSGGVFLAMAFVHLLPEAQEEMEVYHINYPLSYALALCGYAFILFVEKVLADTTLWASKPKPALQSVHVDADTGMATGAEPDHGVDHSAALTIPHTHAPALRDDGTASEIRYRSMSVLDKMSTSSRQIVAALDPAAGAGLQDSETVGDLDPDSPSLRPRILGRSLLLPPEPGLTSGPAIGARGRSWTRLYQPRAGGVRPVAGAPAARAAQFKLQPWRVPVKAGDSPRSERRPLLDQAVMDPAEDSLKAPLLSASVPVGYGFMPGGAANSVQTQRSVLDTMDMPLSMAGSPQQLLSRRTESPFLPPISVSRSSSAQAAAAAASSTPYGPGTGASLNAATVHPVGVVAGASSYLEPIKAEHEEDDDHHHHDDTDHHHQEHHDDEHDGDHHHDHHEEHDDGSHGHSHAPVDGLVSNNAAYLLMLALSLHSVFEGIALGVESETGQLFTLFLGIVLHKWAEAVALVTSFIKTRRSFRKVVGFMLLFTLASPLGIVIGVGISSFGSDVMVSVFKSLASGTFIYVGANEIVSEEFETTLHRRTKLVAFVLGAGFICSLAVIQDE